MIAAGLVALTYSLTSLTLVIPGMFMAFTYSGTIMSISDIELLLMNKNGTKKVVLNKFSNFEDARKNMDELKGSLLSLNNMPDI